MEDTDRIRSTPRFEAAAIEDLDWLGLVFDEGPKKGGSYGPYRQSERLDIYLKYAARLIEEGAAYRCYCSKERLEALKKEQLEMGRPPRYDRRCRHLKALPKDVRPAIRPAIRFAVPQGKIEFIDLVHGPMSFEGGDIGDFIIVGEDNVATYNFAVTVDDALMEITHVLRGEDHLSNTPRQLLIFRALGFRPPEYLHLPLVLDPDRTPMGKRHSPLSIRNLCEEGYLPEAILNATAHLGWAPAEGLLTLAEMSELFTPQRLSKSPSIFDMETLKRRNRMALKTAPLERLLKLLSPFPADIGEDRIKRAIEYARESAATLSDVTALITRLFAPAEITNSVRESLEWPHSIKALSALKAALEGVGELNEETSKTVINRLKEAGLKGKDLFTPIRTALTGKAEGMEVDRLLKILGKKEVLKRLHAALGGN